MSANFSGGWLGGTLAAALVLGFALLALRPGDRAAVRNCLLLLGAAALALLGANVAGPSRGSLVATEIAALVAGLLLVRLAGMFVFRVALAAAGISPPRIVADLATAAGYLVWGFMWLRLAGVDLPSLITGSAIVTAAVALSMQDTLGNMLGGVLLQLDDSIREGDWLRVDDFSGRVAQVRWRHTTLVTANGERLILPNAWLLKNRFAVAGAVGVAAVRRWVRLPVDLSASPGEVCRVLAETVANAEIDNVAPSPAPDVLVVEVAARHAIYAIRYWVRDAARADATDSAVRIHALATLARNGMKLGAPYEEQFTIQDGKEQRTALAAADRERRLRALARVDIFAPLSQAEREALAPHLRYAPFVAGDVMTRQGAVAHWLYLVISGEADVWVDAPGGRRRVGELRGGDIFGEMGMLTGEPRSATVIARTDATCYRLDKAGFESVLHARPDLAEAISRVLAGRRAQLEDGLAAARAPDGSMRHDELLDRVRRFFGLPGSHPARKPATTGTG